MHILPFTADMVEDAAKLLASRHQKDRLATAALPCRFEREQDAPIAIEAEWNKQGTSGAAAIKMGSSSAIFSGKKRQVPFADSPQSCIRICMQQQPRHGWMKATFLILRLFQHSRDAIP
ncbi:hypothetical protein [Brevibacillus centrosporus]|uniref:hypothetical protein n=1 Tax=Brevibacillus centrosporus TaxID=54910 RepID=UPI003B0145C9